VETLPHTVQGLCPAEVNMGKGSRPRPFSVSQDKFADSFEGIFGKRVPTYMKKLIEEDNMQVRVKENVDEIGSCGCGRSPTGKCIGWHGLSEAEFQKRLVEYQEKNK
jgi:hypothetical protein